MIIFIPRQLITFITFPGVILHEISHKFYCDRKNIEVYEVCYLNILSKKAGHVVHKRTEVLADALAIGRAPLIINSIVCMILTFPAGISFVLHTTFTASESNIWALHAILAWIGYSIGYHAMPSNADVAGLTDMATSKKSKFKLMALTIVIKMFNVYGLGILLRLLYTFIISMILPIFAIPFLGIFCA